MEWNEVRETYPGEWLVIEALQAYTTAEQYRKLIKIAVVEHCLNGSAAFQSYRRLHQEHPEREFYFVHTSREELSIREQQWLGIRRNHAVSIER